MISGSSRFCPIGLSIRLALYEVLRGGGFKADRFNFDSKARRQSVNPIDVSHGHNGGIDGLARSRLNAAHLKQRGDIAAFGTVRYAGRDRGIGV